VRKVFLIAILLGIILVSVKQSNFSAAQESTVTGGVTVQKSAIKVTVTTGGGLYGPVKAQYKAGEDIPVVISMTNTTDQPVKYCRSTFFFQNRPQLKRDGQLVPYISNLPEQTEKDEFITKCETSAARQFYVLQPKQTRVVDWFTLNKGVIDLYGALPPGHYELLLLRRVECCQGPLSESDKVSFEVVP
jgi:hypothetical protein